MTLLGYLKEIRKNGKRSFTLEQAMLALDASKNTALNAISRLKHENALICPTHGLYVIVPPEHQLQGCIPAEELVPILMNYLKADYYVSLLSGAQYYGATHQKPGCFQVVSDKRLKHLLEFGLVKIELIYKKSLARLPVRDVTVSTGYLKVATPELVVLDLLSYPGRSGGLNHVATVLSELTEAVDANHLINLAELSGEKAWLQRLGYILEHIDTTDVAKTEIVLSKLEEYLRNKTKFFVSLAPEIPKAGYLRSKKWMIIENTTIESDL